MEGVGSMTKVTLTIDGEPIKVKSIAISISKEGETKVEVEEEPRSLGFIDKQLQKRKEKKLLKQKEKDMKRVSNEQLLKNLQELREKSKPLEE
jgi:uncharacterized protein (DUF1697 family)